MESVSGITPWVEESKEEIEFTSCSKRAHLTHLKNSQSAVATHEPFKVEFELCIM
jgi:hypothetical protein